MKILGLPGINPVTEDWMKQLFSVLDLGQTDTTVQPYQCWNFLGSKLDLEQEVETAAEKKADIIIAKSIGTVLALNGYHRNLFIARKCIFIGIPIVGLGINQISMLKEQITDSISMLFIQQTNDRAGSIAELRKTVTDSNLVKVAEIPGNDHMYKDIHQLKDIIEKWHENETRK